MSHAPLPLAFAVTASLLAGGVTPVSAHDGSTSDAAPTADLDGAGAGAGVYAQTDDASASFPGNLTVDGTTVEVTRAELPAGGFVRLVDGGGEVVGRSGYLEPGRHTATTAELGTPLFETQRLRAELVRAVGGESYTPGAPGYTVGDAVVNGSAVVDFPPEPTETPAATDTVTDTATPTATPYPVATRTPLSPSGATQSSLPLSPGVAVVAVLAAAALLARRGGSS